MSANTASSVPSIVTDAVVVGELDGAALGRRAVGPQEHDLAGLLVDEHGVAVGRRRRQRAAARR